MNRLFLSTILGVVLGVTVFAKSDSPSPIQTATFGMGCFWCTEALYERFQGVGKIACGYTGGSIENPAYEEVCSGTTGHAEVAQITFDPKVISYAQLLEIFWEVHDPTTLNRQGADAGTQYRSIILYENEEQKKLAEASKIEAQKKSKKLIVTEIVPLKVFYLAEEYHQAYFKNHPNVPYCVSVISPKLQKLEKHPELPKKK